MWAGKPGVATSADSGYHVLRHEFDRRLRDHARLCGASVVDGHVSAVDGREPLSVQVVANGGERSAVVAEFVLDSGARVWWHVAEAVSSMQGIARSLLPASGRPRLGAGEHTHTLVESYADGWA